MNSNPDSRCSQAEYEFLELISFALIMLGERNDTRPAAKTILKRLDRLAIELSEKRASFSQLIRQRICDHRADLAFEAQQYQEASEFAAMSCTLAPPDTAAYYNSTFLLAQSLFSLGESEKAYRVLAGAIRESILHGVERAETSALLRAANREEIRGLDRAGDFANALAALAKRLRGIPAKKFWDLWLEDPRKALNAVAESELS